MGMGEGRGGDWSGHGNAVVMYMLLPLRDTICLEDLADSIAMALLAGNGYGPLTMEIGILGMVAKCTIDTQIFEWQHQAEIVQL